MIAVLAAVWLLASPQAGPVADPAVTAAMRLPFLEAEAEMERLAEAGSVGARAIHDGYAALRRRDFPAACRLWEAAAGLSAEAAHMTAECYEHGHAGTTDMDRAIDLYRSAGDGGYPKSLCALGLIYVVGEAVPADPVRGAELCRRGAEAGDPDAQTDLGDFYRRGSGVPRDYALARHWYERAAARNQRNAAYNLGAMAWNGHGGPVDLAAAGAWMEKAYEAGRRDAPALAGRAALIRAVPNAPNGPVDVGLLALAKRWFLVAMEEDPDQTTRAEAAVTLARISGYEAMARQQAGDE
ncbi:MAG TPA: tetratricopeptide repeat protein [Brevundimonas sp.]|nr:tetratricopeptide repeat protein [Brevundimonas sp.]